MKTYVFGVVHSPRPGRSEWMVGELHRSFASSADAMLTMRAWNRDQPFGPGEFYLYWLKRVEEDGRA